ncbi:MAG: hypothetical protein JNM17_28500 [Archangium sp.]|nr:hypothetical protein [Archangium sp.]
MVEAEYQLTRCENVWTMSVPLWTVMPLSRERTFLYGIVPECDVVGRVEGQGGRKNHTISYDLPESHGPYSMKWVPRGGAWVMQHLGHSLPIQVNGVGRMSSEPHRLVTGDVIRPGPGIEFTFSLTTELAPILALLAREGRTVIDRVEPLIDHTIELFGCDSFQARRIIDAALARRRGLPPPPR